MTNDLTARPHQGADFAARHIGPDESSIARMLQAVGYGSLDALTDAHQLRLQHVGEVLPIRAVAKGLQAIINCSS